MAPPTNTNIGKSRPVLVTFSVLAALQVLSGGAALADVIGKEAFGLFVLLIAAIQVGLTFYVQNQVVPFEDTAAYVDTKGNVVAGPASPPRIADGASVEVTQTPSG